MKPHCSLQRVASRIVVVVLFILVATAISWSQSARFLVLSDWGGFGSNDQKSVAAAMGKEASRIKAQFVLTAGDNYHGDGIASADEVRWKTEYEDVYAAPSLQIPWYPSLGNHDNVGSASAEILYSTRSKRWNFPSRYYAHEEPIDQKERLLIIHLDTSPFVGEYLNARDDKYHLKGQDSKKQVRWLDSVLSVSHSRWTLVVGHHPIYSAAPKHGDTKELIGSVLPILQKYHVPLYVCGHDHVLQHLKDGSMDFFVCGGGAETREAGNRADVVYSEGKLGFLSVSVTMDKLKVNYVGVDDNVLHSAEISAPRRSK